MLPEEVVYLSCNHTGKSMKKSIIINGVSYPSYTAAAKSLGINRSTLVSRVKAANGGPVSVTAPSEENVVIDGQAFSNITAAATALGLPRATLQNRLDAGWSGSKVASKKSYQNRSKQIRIGTKLFPSIKAMLSTLSLHERRYGELKRDGLSPQQVVEKMMVRQGVTPRYHVEVAGRHFANIGEALDYFGISFLTYFDEKMKGGEPVDVVSRIIDAETTYREAA